MSLLKICTLLGVFFAFNSSTIPYCASISASVLNFKRNAEARIKPFASANCLILRRHSDTWVFVQNIHLIYFVIQLWA